MGVIYLRTNLVNGMQYVGQTKNLKNREHHWKLLKWRYANQLLTNDREKYGLGAFKIDILEECDNSRLDELERFYIEKYNTLYPNGYNTTKGGTISFHHSEETKKKMSEIAQGKKNIFKKGHTPWNKGKKMPKEFCEKMSKTAKNRYTGKKHPFYGKHHSEETKKKMSEAKIGKHFSKETEFPSKKVYQYDLEGKLIAIWPSANEAARQNDISQAGVSLACKSGKKSKGYKWSYTQL